MCSSSLAKRKPKVNTGYLLGTVCSISLYDKGSDAILDGAFRIVRDVDQKMNMGLEGSEIRSINAASGSSPLGVSADTLEVIKAGIASTKLSKGRFDITIGPLVTLWGIGTKDARIPDKEEISKALELIGVENIVLQEEGHTVWLKKSGMKLDLGGIAKGYAADAVRDYLKAQGVNRAIIDFGGNIFVLGSKEGHKPWRVGIQHPVKKRGAYIGVLQLTNKAAVTSGKYERFMETGGKRYHHILDTSTGYPVDNLLSSVTVVADDSMTADAMSTGIFAAGLEDGLRIAEAHEEIEAVLVTEDGLIYLSSGLVRQFTIANPEFRLAK
jgi:thiamine biosynthesis lipoprotein